MAMREAKAPKNTNRKKKIPEIDRADITGDQLLSIVHEVKADIKTLTIEDASAIAGAINANAYFGVSSHQLRAQRQHVVDAAHTLLTYLEEIGYPMVEQLAALHVKLEAALPFLMPPGWQPIALPYVPAAIYIHTQSCWICLKAGLEAGMSRDSVAVRLTSAILSRLDYSVTPAALEAFLQDPKVKVAFADSRSDLL